ncbi:MAG: hypothetical protein G01um10148_1042 [Parcubacteria group bacterium Gr01-1014_8]|nr:MAG: hypothetical protein G01um10148_1042 [Parcubacteria group bacterium Gr01-1014_8]
MKEDKGFRQLNATTRDVIESVVIDWIDKYYIENSNLAVKHFNNPEEIKLWVQGVWGRITHQLSGSGLPYNNDVILANAGKSFFDLISRHREYEKIKPHLPRAVTMHDKR